MKKTIYIGSLFTIFLVLLALNLNVVTQNTKLLENNKNTEEVIFDNCSNKFFELTANENYIKKYTKFSLKDNLGNLKCINSIGKIDHKNMTIYISFGNGISNYIIYFFMFLTIVLNKYLRLRILLSIYLIAIAFDFYNFGYSLLGYPDFLPLILLVYLYNEK